MLNYMNHFNDKVTLDQILVFFNWELTITDLIQLESKNYPVSIEKSIKNKIRHFDEEFNSYLHFRRNEFLYTSINEQRNHLSKFNLPLAPTSDEDYLFIDDFNYYNLCHGFYRLYSEGKNSNLKYLETSILPVIESGLNHSIAMFDLGSTPDYGYKVEEINIEALNIFNNYVYSALRLVVTTVDFLKYLEERRKNINGTHSEIDDQTGKIIFKGTPAQFAYIIDLLIGKDYLKSPSEKGETKARFLLNHFHFETSDPSVSSLGRKFSSEEDAIKNMEHKNRFNKIPNRKELDK
jgi:hypothetical protein